MALLASLVVAATTVATLNAVGSFQPQSAAAPFLAVTSPSEDDSSVPNSADPIPVNVPLPDPVAAVQSVGEPSVDEKAANAEEPVSISYPAIGMNQSVVPLSPSRTETDTGSIVPPATTDAYWLAPFGVPGPTSTNTTYIIGHSWAGRSSPFNNISSAAKSGDIITLGTVHGAIQFRVDSVTTENKDTLRDSSIWDIVPGRLVLITCFTEDLWGKNILVIGTPITS